MIDDAFIETLLSETCAALRRNMGNADGIKAVVFLFLSRAYEAKLEPDRICELLGASNSSVLNRAKLPKVDEATVMDAYESLDPILEQQYALSEPDSSPPPRS
jgi:hypothetical protein